MQQLRAKITLLLSGLWALVQLYHSMTQLQQHHHHHRRPSPLQRQPHPHRQLQHQQRRNGTATTTTTAAIPRHCPQSTTTDRAALCVVVKDEEAYLDEFINYHWALGFDTIYVHDNADHSFELGQWGRQKTQALLPTTTTCPGRPPPQLHVQHTPGAGRQMELLENCARTAQAEGHTWAAFFDADEYLVLFHQEHVIDYLHATMTEGGSLAIPWVDMTTTTAASASNATTQEEEERRVTYAPVPLTLRYQYREEDGNKKSRRRRHIKTIATLADVDHTTPRHNPHVVPLRPGAVQRTVWGDITEGPTIMEDARSGPAALYHYGTKSYKEYYRKRQRGRATVRSNHKSNRQLLRIAQQLLHELPPSTQRRVVYDPTAWEHLVRLVPAYDMWNDAAWRTLIVM